MIGQLTKGAELQCTGHRNQQELLTTPKELRRSEGRSENECTEHHDTRDLRQPRTSSSELQCRAQKLNFIEALVLKFNGADFDGLSKALAGFCDQGIISHVALAFDPTKQSMAKTAGCHGSEVHSVGISSVLLLWMMLHETHPDGVMQVLDKRACYHIAPANRDLCMLSVPSCEPKDTCAHFPSGKHAICCGRSSAADTGSSATAVEVVIKFKGICITSRSLQEAFRDLARGELPPSSDEQSDELGNCVPQTGALANYIAAYLAMDGSCVVRAERQPQSSGKLGGRKKGEQRRVSSISNVSTDTRLPHNSSRGYLLEVRVIFNERCRIVDWTTLVLAEEAC